MADEEYDGQELDPESLPWFLRGGVAPGETAGGGRIAVPTTPQPDSFTGKTPGQMEVGPQAASTGPWPRFQTLLSDQPDATAPPTLGQRISGKQPKVATIAPEDVSVPMRQPTPVDHDNLMLPPAVGGPDPASVAPSSPTIIKSTLDTARQVPPMPPTSPTLPGLLQQRADLGKPLDRNAVDPNTGKSMYKMGLGQRLLGSLANFASGYNHQGPVEYVGPGATNHRFDTDTADRATQVANVGQQITDQEKLDEQNRKLYDTTSRDAMTAQLREQQAGSAEERARHNQQVEGLTQQLRDSQQQRADQQNDQRAITYDAKSKTFMRGDQPYSPKTVEEGAMLEGQFGINGPNTKLWNAERRNQPTIINNGRTPQLSAKDQMRVDAYAREHNTDADSLTSGQLNEALGGPAGSAKGIGKQPVATFKDNAAVDKYGQQWYNQRRNAVDLEKERWLKLNTDKESSDPEAQAAFKKIEDQYAQDAAAFEQRKKGYYAALNKGPVAIDDNGNVINNQSTTAPASTPAKAPAALATQTARTAAVNPQSGIPAKTPHQDGEKKVYNGATYAYNKARDKWVPQQAGQ